MHISFSNERLQRLCCCHDEMTAEWGAAVAGMLAQRLHEINACPSLEELKLLPHVRVEVLKSLAEGLRISLRLSSQMEMVFEARTRPGDDCRANPDWSTLTDALVVLVRTQGKEGVQGERSEI